jgi:hypothetical protein
MARNVTGRPVVAAHVSRACQAWHRASGVNVLTLGVSRAIAEESGKGITVRWGLREASSTDAGRRTGTRVEVWHHWDERARARAVLHPMARLLNPESMPGQLPP